jgi:CBS domain-containing protein
MRAPDFMTSPAVTLSARTTIRDAGVLLLDHGYNAVPVVDDQEQLIGIVSEADLLRGRVGADPRAHLRPLAIDASTPPATVGEVMTEQVCALPATADQGDFAAAMIRNKVKTIPVVVGGRVVGMVSASDLLRTYIRTDDQIARDVTDRLRRYAGGASPWSVTVSDGVVTLTGRAAEPHGRLAVVLAETVPGVTRVHTTSGNAVADGAVGPIGSNATQGPTDHRGLRVLATDECVERLRSSRVGRLGFMDGGEVVVLPVNHAVDHRDVVFRTTWGSKLQVAGDARAVAFEVDGSDEGRRVGWSVLAKGDASIVYDDAEIERLDAIPLATWAGDSDEMFWVRVRILELTGRELLWSSADQERPVPVNG